MICIIYLVIANQLSSILFFQPIPYFIHSKFHPCSKNCHMTKYLFTPSYILLMWKTFSKILYICDNEYSKKNSLSSSPDVHLLTSYHHCSKSCQSLLVYVAKAHHPLLQGYAQEQFWLMSYLCKKSSSFNPRKTKICQAKKE